jgi:hypothetical protein
MDPSRSQRGPRRGCRLRSSAPLTGLDLGAEPSGRTRGAPRYRRARGDVLEAHGQGARTWPEADDHGHLHHARRGPRRHHAPDPGALLRVGGAAEQIDLRPDLFGRPGSELLGRTEARQNLDEYLSELPRPRGAQPGRMTSPAIRASGAARSGGPAWRRAQPGGPASTRFRSAYSHPRAGRDGIPGRGRFADRGRFTGRFADRGRFADGGGSRRLTAGFRSRRAGGAVGLAVIRRPPVRHPNQPRPVPGRLPARPSAVRLTGFVTIRRAGWLGRSRRGDPAGDGRKVGRASPRGHVLLPVRRMRTTANAP